jgi:glycosyltransferase involved in cell wall biosynthesis
MVARFDPQKDVSNFLEALAALSSAGTRFACLMVGTGMTTDNVALGLSIKARGLEDHIRLVGRRSDIPAIMNALDLLVLPSAYGEAFPNVVAEAMACGTPVTATDVGDSASIIGNTGWVVPPRDSGALADAIAKALGELGDSNACARRQAACRERIVTNFTQDRMVAKYNAIWREATSSFN